MKKEFRVVVDVPSEVSMYYIKDYIKEALQVWGGQRHPDDPLFSMRDRIKSVTLLRKPKK